MITLNSIKNTFSKIEEDGTLNVKEELLWGYFFTSKKLESFTAIIKELEQAGMTFVKTYKSGDSYWLHMEEVRIHTPESLFAKCETYYQLVENYNLDSYDGYDVGKVE